MAVRSKWSSKSNTLRHALSAQISAALAFTLAIDPLISGLVDQYLGFRAVFLVLVCMSIVIFCYTFLCLPETYQVEKRVQVKLLPLIKRLLNDPKLMTYGFLIGAINGILFSYYVEAPFIFIEHFHLSAAVYGFLGIGVAGASILGSLLSKRYRFIAQKKSFIRGCAVCCWGVYVFC